MLDADSYQVVPNKQDILDNDSLPKFDYEIDIHDIINGTLVIVKHFFGWKKNIECSICTAGLTNKLVKVQYKTTTVLVRIYGRGTDLLIDREQELKNLMRLSQLGFCPGIYGSFTNGMVYGYVEGQVFSTNDMVQKSFLVAQHMSGWHRIESNQKPQLFHTLKRWLSLLPEQYSDDEKTRVFQRMGYTRQGLEKEALLLEKRLLTLKSPVVFCHNDVQVGNIIYDKQTNSVRFIDYEYGCVSYRGFDIGNHFCEFGGTSGDYSKYPSREFQLNWFRDYLTSSGLQSNTDNVEKLYREVNGFALASHFLWSIWAFIQAEISDIEFDYLGYAELRLSEYFKRKSEWLP